MIPEVALKYFKEFYRAKVSFFILFLFPFFFLFIFNLAFGGAEIGGLSTYSITIVNNDEGIPPEMATALPPGLDGWKDEGVGNNLSEIILSSSYTLENGSHQPIFKQQPISDTNYTEAVIDGETQLVLTIPSDFSLMVLNLINNVYANQSIPGFPTNVNASITFISLADDTSATVAKSIAQSIIDQFMQAIVEERVPTTVTIEANNIVPEEISSIFDFIAAGIFVFATILAASVFVALLLSDEDTKAIRRVKLSKISSYEYLAGFILFSFILMIIQYLFLFIAADIFFNFDPVGSIPRAFVIMLVTSLATYALIFTTASFFNESDTAGSALGFSSSILGFASGAFFEMPEVILVRNVFSFTSGSPHLLLWDLFPWTHAVNAMRAILVFDRSLADVFGDFILLTIMSLIWLVVSLWVYHRKAFQREDL